MNQVKFFLYLFGVILVLLTLTHNNVNANPGIFGGDDAFPFEDVLPEPAKKMENKAEEQAPTGNIPFLSKSVEYPTCNAAKDKKPGASSSPSCALSIEELGSGNLVAGTSTRSDSLLPSWINIELAKKGQKFYNKHFGAIFISYLTTAVLFVLIPQGAEITLFSGNSDTVDKFAKRYTATASQFALWSRDLFNEGSNTENIKQSIKRVRNFHLGVVPRVVEAMKKSGPKLGLDVKYANYTFKYPKFWESLEKDLKVSNIPEKYRSWTKSYSSTSEQAVPINQFVLAMSQWTLAGLVGAFSKAVLIHNPADEELTGFNHFYAVIGYCLGIDDAYNVALQPSLAAQTQFYKDILFHYLVPNLFNLNRYSKILVEVIADAMVGSALPVAYKVKGFESETPVTVTMEALVIRLFKDYIGIPATNIEANSSPETKSFTAWWEGTFAPASVMPFFHEGLTDAANSAMTSAGVKTFCQDYSTDESISRNVFV